jgi:prolipoprotein diacylglyceryl transferase
MTPLAYITIDLNPMLGHLGPFPVRWYGLFMGLATLAGMVIVAVRFARRGIDPWRVFPMLIFAVPLGIIGARLFNVIDDFGFYRSDPGAIVSLPLGGLAIYGVIVGGVGGIVAYCWWRRLPILRVLDCLALAIPVGQLIGRCANIVNGDTWGYATRLPWAFVYTNRNALLPARLLGVPTQPTPVYEQLWLVVVIVLVWRIEPRLKTPGMAFVLYLGLYSFGRFFISFERVNNILFLGLREAQLVALIVLVLSVPAALWLRRRGSRASAGE